MKNTRFPTQKLLSMKFKEGQIFCPCQYFIAQKLKWILKSTHCLQELFWFHSLVILWTILNIFQSLQNFNQKGRGCLISDSILKLIQSSRLWAKSLSLNVSLHVKLSDFAHLYVDKTKLKIPSEIKQQLILLCIILWCKKLIVREIAKLCHEQLLSSYS